MKKWITFASLAFLCIPTMGQISLGSAYLMGGLNLFSSTNTTESGNTTTENYKNNYSQIDIGGGYFVTERIAAGIFIDAGGDTYKYMSGSADMREKDSWTHFGVFGRYFIPCAGNLYSSVSLNVNFGSGKYIVDDGTNSTTWAEYGDTQVYLVPGLMYFFADNVAFELAYGWLGWSQQKEVSDPGEDTEQTQKVNYTGLNLNSKTLRLGFSWFFL